MFEQILIMIALVSALLLLLDFIFLARKRTRKAPVIVGIEYAFILSAIAYGVTAYNFECVLTFATLAAGLMTLLDIVIFSRLRKKRYDRMSELRAALNPDEKAYLSNGLPVLVDYARSFFWVLVLVLILRSFLFEPFRIPSASLEPTLLTGDFILVDKFSYGIRLPVINKKIIKIHEPKRGDIVVFHWPVDTKVDFIKRVVGVPGDTISYIDKVFYINGQEATQLYQEAVPYYYANGNETEAYKLRENLLGVEHEIYQFPSNTAENFTDIVVPEGMYFMIGDNRDDSGDSRYWGFVPESYIVGKPQYVLLSWNKNDWNMRWNRMGLPVQVKQTTEGQEEKP